ncbi:hypothetical protein BHE74_00058484 [Ensete ventricosum]|nr:hypothetical protein GW17_00007241 [Ensete ventricosum]RWW36495.1 hypothetical protein BHE74_00058484 [Ensete ventricosum]
MAKSGSLLSNLARVPPDLGEFWRECAGGGWATTVVVFLLFAWQLLRLFFSRRRHRAASRALESSPASATRIDSEEGSSAGFALDLLLPCFSSVFVGFIAIGNWEKS